MQNPEPFEPLKVGRYTVIRLAISYSGEPPAEKTFVVLRHHKKDGKDRILCLKATSKTARYENDPELLKGCVLLQSGECPLFRLKTVIEVGNPHGIYHEVIRDKAKKGEYKIEGKMPEDFHGRLVSAIQNCDVYNMAEKNTLLEAIGEIPQS